MARPPMTNDGRTMTGYPMRSASVSDSSIDSAMPPSGCGIPSRSRSAENRVRSSAWSIVSRLEPSSGTPECTSGAARLSGVWPPYATTAGSVSGPPRVPPLSNATMLRTLSGSSGSKYRRVDASKSVDTVSGFEFTITALQPSRRNTSAAWTAQ